MRRPVQGRATWRRRTISAGGRRLRRALIVVVLGGVSVLAVPTLATAQGGLVARADSAFAAENRALARSLYEDVLRTNPSQSRAIFRLAQLEPDAHRALTLFRRYCALEPRDPWGPMAEGDLLARTGRVEEALSAYDRAARVAPDERDVALGRARLLVRAGRGAEAREVLERWTAHQPADSEAWDLLGRELSRAGKPRAASHAFLRAGPTARSRLRSTDLAAAPSFEPTVSWQRDSDGNVSLAFGGGADVLLVDGLRFGVAGHHGVVQDASTSQPFNDAAALFQLRPAQSVRMQVKAGGRQFAQTTPDDAWTEPEFDARLRWRSDASGATVSVRAQRMALAAAPLLVTNHVTRSDLAADAQLSLGALRVMGGGRAGVLQSRVDGANRRFGYDGALIVAAGPTNWSVQYHSASFARSSTVGYFAPRRAQTVEGAVYLETSGDSRLTLSADLGAGMQRLARQEEPVGPWKQALRGWALLSLALGPSRSLWTEVEAYDSPFAPAGVAISSSWRYVAITSGLRWAL